MPYRKLQNIATVIELERQLVEYRKQLHYKHQLEENLLGCIEAANNRITELEKLLQEYLEWGAIKGGNKRVSAALANSPATEKSLLPGDSVSSKYRSLGATGRAFPLAAEEKPAE